MQPWREKKRRKKKDKKEFRYNPIHWHRQDLKDKRKSTVGDMMTITTRSTRGRRQRSSEEYSGGKWAKFRQSTSAIKSNLVKHKLIALLFSLTAIVEQVASQCPEKTMTSFEKISGVTIKDAPLTILFSAPNFTSPGSSVPFAGSNSQQQQLNELTRQLMSPSATSAAVYPITAECNNRCRRNPKCRAFLVDYSRHTCWSVEQPASSSASSASSLSSTTGLIRSPTPIQLAQTNERTAYFEKVCLNLPSVDCERAWIFERSINHHLHGYDDKIIEDVPSRLRCQEHCLNEREFRCRSGEYDYLSMQCRLSVVDRHLKPHLFRPTSSSSSGATISSNNNNNNLVDYFENQCAPMSAQQQCDSFDRFEDLDLGRPEIMRLFNTSDQCQQYCTQTIKAFICRSFTWSPLTGKCYLNSANSLMVGGLDKLVPAPGLIYYQRNDCIDLKLECDTTAMTLNLRTSEPFRGRMYVRDDPNLCGDTSLARGGGSAGPNGGGGGGLINSLIIPFHSNQGRCANRELPSRYSSVVVVQQHPLIQRKSDRYIKLVCDFQTANKTITSEYKVLANPWTSTALINATSFAPKVKLRITDKFGNDVPGAKLGDELQLRIEAETESVYDMVARSVLAKSGQTDESIVLIDRDGCPSDYRIFPPLRKLNKRVIIGKFDAFKFSSDVVVRFQVDVQFCLNVCPPTNCNQNHHQHHHQLHNTDDNLLLNSADGQPADGQLLNSQQQLTPEGLALQTTASPSPSASSSTTTTSSTTSTTNPPANLVPNELASGISTQSPLNQLDQYMATHLVAGAARNRQTSARPSDFPQPSDGQTFEAAALAPTRHHHAYHHHHHPMLAAARAADANNLKPTDTIEQPASVKTNTNNNNNDSDQQQNSHRKRRRRSAEPLPAVPKHVPLEQKIIVEEGPSNSQAKEQQQQQQVAKSKRRDARQRSSTLPVQKGNSNSGNNTASAMGADRQNEQASVAGQQDYYSTSSAIDSGASANGNLYPREPLLCTTWSSLVFSILAFCALQLLTIGLCMAAWLHRHRKQSTGSRQGLFNVKQEHPVQSATPSLASRQQQQQQQQQRQSNTFMHQVANSNGARRLY